MSSALIQRPNSIPLAHVPALFARKSKAARHFLEYFAANINISLVQ